ncbi:CcoQ Cbb3-type cytochrome oxidase, subunit 3 [Oxalobacteraceae bacterium]
MSMIELISDARSIVTLICLLTFIGIVVWAYSARRKSDFDEAAMLPFADEEPINSKEQERHYG